MQKRKAPAKPLAERTLERRADLGVLREDKRRLAGLQNLPHQFDEAIQLRAADLLAVEAVAHKFKPRQKREDVALRMLARAEILKRRIVVAELRGSERAVLADLALRAEIDNRRRP